MIKFIDRMLTSLYIYSTAFWFISLGLHIFKPSPKTSTFFFDVAAPVTLSVVAIAMCHWAYHYRKLLKGS
ncbi:hypothetical protein OBP_230 [Pseudomonas phage OBP]|uniref:hypothetical protein n=1 Tax=Pseudomonas phage OBP TaxID=1124849 RepID=UPI000240D5CA|nr:hypothetical protein OBP_230 [Pseudomonas phage OBP]AEV89667.1 hypothetical protein OBP_230 [Pseudomonas phage OBP]